jgi:rRNA maturation RNase YbeY
MINFIVEDVSFKLKNKNLIRKWIKEIFRKFAKEKLNINIVLCSDDYLLKKNIEFLDHDTFTDVITFDYSNDLNIVADILISIDRIKENSAIYNVIVENELNRVIVHGILHILGYNDKSEEEKKLMRSMEDKFLNEFNTLIYKDI